MSGEYRATDKDWELVEGWAPDDTDVRCLLELRSRVEALEKVIRVITGSLTPAEQAELGVVSVKDLQADLRSIAFEAMKAAQEATQHAHLDGSQMSEADREAMKEPGKVVTDQPEPAPLATDQDLYQLYDLTGPTVVDAFRAIYDLGRQHGAAQVAPVQSLMERVEALASGDAPVFDPLTNVTGKGVTVEGSFEQDGTTYVFKTAAQPAPSVKESLTAAPAGPLVERLAWIIEPDDPLVWRGTCGLILREVAAWLRGREGRHTHSSVVIAGDLEQEASR